MDAVTGTNSWIELGAAAATVTGRRAFSQPACCVTLASHRGRDRYSHVPHQRARRCSQQWLSPTLPLGAHDQPGCHPAVT